jgi:hypothetical protein
MFKKALAIFLPITFSLSANAGARYDLKEPIESGIVPGNYVCQNVEDLQTIYSVTTLFSGSGTIGRQVAQKFVDKDLCYLIQANTFKATITSLQVGDDPSGVSQAYVFALSTFVTSKGESKAAWAHMAAFPALMKQDDQLAGMIAQKRVSGSGAYLLDNTYVKAMRK